MADETSGAAMTDTILSAGTPPLETSGSSEGLPVDETRLLAALSLRPIPVGAVLSLLTSGVQQVRESAAVAQKKVEAIEHEAKSRNKEGDFEMMRSAALAPCMLQRKTCLEALLVAQGAFRDAGEFSGLVDLLLLQTQLEPEDDRTAENFQKELATAAQKRRVYIAMTDSAFSAKSAKSVADSLHIIQSLLGFEAGTMCYDKTWGFGVIKRVDDFYKRFIIDFETKRGHAMTFEYAVGSGLRRLDDGHVLVRAHRDPAAFAEQVKKAPDEVVFAVLRDLGAMSVTRLEDEFARHRLLPAGQTWKSFWTCAKARLSKNKQVALPPSTKKNEPIRVVESRVDFGDEAWFKQLAKERDVAAILAAASQIESKLKGDAFTPEARAILAERLVYAYKAAKTQASVQKPAIETADDMAVSNDSLLKKWRDKTHLAWGNLVRSAVAVDALKLENVPLADWIKELATPAVLFQAAPKLSTGDTERFITLLPLKDDIEVAGPFVDQLPEMPYSLMEVVMPVLLRGAAQKATEAKIRENFAKDFVPFPILLWVAKHQNEKDVVDLVTAPTLAAACLLSLELETAGEELRLFHLLARCFEDKKWLSRLMERMDDDGRQALLDRIRDVEHGWEPPTKRRMISDILAEYPDLATRKVVEPEPEPAERLTSWRMLEARREARRKLVEEEIPKNAHDIDVARSYGDLRENFEYQTAKDTQRMLQQRLADYEEQLSMVKGTDFADVPTDTVAPGVEVVLLVGGAEEVYDVLGEWDSDEALRIVSSRSRLGEALLGKKAGDAVTLPGVSSPAAIKEIRSPSAAVKSWIMGH